jgi:glycosyltransferase A (GT-A) superfamily protein (DUF2064 family)
VEETALFGAVIVIAKEPVPGRVKTRLVPPLTYAQAADLAAAALTDTLRVAETVSARCHLLAWDGCSDEWLPGGWSITEQPEGDLDARLISAFDVVARDAPAILIGMDTPQVQATQLTAFDPEQFDACLGLALDGGYWAIGFRDPAQAAAAISGVPMSREDTGRVQLARLRAEGLRVQLLDELIDVDTYRDALAVAGAAPGTDFAAAVRSARMAG